MICGDPEEVKNDVKNPVSFTRFVFPFAYSPCKLLQNTSEIGPLFYEEIPYDHLDENHPDKKIFLQRIKYFTRETGNALYDRAKWLQIPSRRWKESSWANGVMLKSLQSGNEFQVAMSPPTLVLFEWSKEIETDQASTCPNILMTGFLITELWFPELRGAEKNLVSFDDLLDINELFRCFDYPGYEKHKERFFDLLGNIPAEYANEGPKKISDLKEAVNSAYFKRWGNLLSIPVKVDDSIFSIVPEGFTDRAIKYLSNPQVSNPQEVERDLSSPEKYLIYNDYRAYVWSAAVLKDGGKSLGRAFYTSQSQAHEYGHWVRFLNVDPPSQGNPTEFEKEWAKDRTYCRWEHLGTWYGFNYHAGVAVLAPCDQDGKPLPFLSHFREIYFDIALLLLYVRVTLFRFSNKLAEIRSSSECTSNKWRNEFEKLRGHFSVFTIHYQYPLLSNQQQAIEMYEIARRHFDIEDFYKEVKSEIDGTHEFLELVQSTKLSNDANILAKWGIPLAVAAVLTGLFGMNWKDLGLYECLSRNGSCLPDWRFWILAVIVIILTPGLSWCIYKFLKRKYDRGVNPGGLRKAVASNKRYHP